MTPFLYVGFDVIPQLAEEIDVPMRTIGRVIVLSILMALGWYALVQWTVGLSLDPATLDGRALPTARRDERPSTAAPGRVACWSSAARSASSRAGTRSSSGRRGWCSRWPAAACSRPSSPASTRGTARPVAVIVLLTAISALAPFFGRPALVWLVDAGSLATVVAYLLVAASLPAHPAPPPGPAPPLPRGGPDPGRLARRRGHAVLPRPLPAGQPLRPRLAPGVGHRAPVDQPRGCLRDGYPASRRGARPRPAGPAHPGELRGSAHFEPCVAASAAALSVARDPGEGVVEPVVPFVTRILEHRVLGARHGQRARPGARPRPRIGHRELPVERVGGRCACSVRPRARPR